MEKQFIELVEVLNKQKLILEQILDAARDHNRALRQLEVNMLQEILRREESLASSLRACEEKRKEITGKIAGQLGISGEDALSRFIEKAPDALKEELNTLLETMRDLVYKTADVNGLNEELARQAIRFNSLMMNALGSPGSTVYAQDGRIDNSRAPSVLNKEV